MAEAARQRWVVTGADEKSGDVKQMTIESVSKERAEATARKNGLLVSSVQPESALNYAGPVESEEEERGTHLESVDAGAAFKLGFYGGLGAMSSWVVLWIIIGGIVSLLGLTISGIAKLFGL